MKRFIDIIFALLMLILLSPFIVVLVVLIRFFLGAPVLFLQDRPGLNGRSFRLVKFRTMRDLYDNDGNMLSDDKRLTKFGVFLRASSLDEVPELWNVLLGEMSLVGPRPLLVEYLPLYSKEQYRRHEVKPGITGWAQVNGRNEISWDKKFELDVWYVDHHSIGLDIKIILLTIIKVFKSEGISHQGHVTMEKFRGSNK
ncbi:MAG: sugar transferase [Gammaproteobacteria bacterium]|nr:sugar transferase [Gammaproteobacteria bacterium]